MITQRYQAVNICSELILHECSYYIQLHGSTHLEDIYRKLQYDGTKMSILAIAKYYAGCHILEMLPLDI